MSLVDAEGFHGAPSQSTPPLESPSHSQEELPKSCHSQDTTVTQVSVHRECH